MSSFKKVEKILAASVVAAFGAGFGAYQAIVNATGQTIIETTKKEALEAKAICLDKLSESNFYSSGNIAECKDFIKEERVNISGKIEYPTDNLRVPENITVQGNLSSTKITTGKFLPKKTIAWLIVEAKNGNCYVLEDFSNLDKSFQKQISSKSIGSPESYTISLLATDDQTVNKTFGDSISYQKGDSSIQNNLTPISCQKGNSSIHRITEVTVSQLQAFNLATRFGGEYGGITVNRNTANQEIILNGTFIGAAGYAIATDPALSSLGGKTLTFQIDGTGNSNFDGDQLFKLEVNQSAVQPTDSSRISSSNPNYITVQDGAISFQLPNNVDKIELVFWNASLNNLRISATVN
ncbi:hypothetical protein [Okeania sp. SIO1I7]|uniref:hypothetical protein n=1 Tax=Okeania sp. SIO1I7 TaxID=2607772 RepID=UPI0013FB2EEB|nr:hypothetical protein [Okeania sp. SIO1I7]NET28648.1 hypothetical protein [Okeania sp. SIO1I7]